MRLVSRLIAPRKTSAGGRPKPYRAPELREKHGEEDRWFHQAASAGRQGESVAADRPGAGAARPQHHGILQAFNAQTQGLEPGMPIPVTITAYADRTFTFKMTSPPNSYFLKKAAGVDKGSQTPGKGTVGKVTMAQIRDIANKKMKDLNAKDLDGACRMIVGSARSMGLEVVE
jgi:large subunit ribosomal protein L11